jgi:hypothetical protein
MIRATVVILALVSISPTAMASCCHHHHRTHWYYQGYNRQDIYRYGPPENGGYRGGYYNGRYHDNTHYDD